jgi:hypothetical protein
MPAEAGWLAFVDMLALAAEPDSRITAQPIMPLGYSNAKIMVFPRNHVCV